MKGNPMILCKFKVSFVENNARHHDEVIASDSRTAKIAFEHTHPSAMFVEVDSPGRVQHVMRNQSRHQQDNSRSQASL